MKILKPIGLVLVLLLAAWALVTQLPLWTNAQAATTQADCSPGSLPQGYQSLNQLLREFDDALTLAINVPRDQIVSQIEELQRVRRQAEFLSVQPCLSDFKTHTLGYMNRVVDLLVAFMGGTPPDLVFQELTQVDLLRQQISEDVALLSGSTVTPQPTPLQFPTSTQSAAISIPVTGASSTVVPQTEPPIATVFNSDGVNLREGPGVEFNFAVVLGPGSTMNVLGADATRQWVYVSTGEGYEGWVFVPLVSLNVSVEDLPILE